MIIFYTNIDVIIYIPWCCSRIFTFKQGLLWNHFAGLLYSYTTIHWIKLHFKIQSNIKRLFKIQINVAALSWFKKTKQKKQLSLTDPKLLNSSVFK